MTVTFSRDLQPSRVSANISDRNVSRSAPNVYPVCDPPFKGYHPPQPEGYEQSKADPSSSAIVIDNGRETTLLLRLILWVGCQRLTD